MRPLPNPLMNKSGLCSVRESGLLGLTREVQAHGGGEEFQQFSNKKCDLRHCGQARGRPGCSSVVGRVFTLCWWSSPLSLSLALSPSLPLSLSLSLSLSPSPPAAGCKAVTFDPAAVFVRMGSLTHFPENKMVRSRIRREGRGPTCLSHSNLLLGHWAGSSGTSQLGWITD